MAEKAFNLLHEPWIRLVRADAVVEERSLTDAILCAHEYVALAGELPTQDAAVLRLMLAVLHAVFQRVDENGASAPLKTAKDAVKRWSALWNMGRFPRTPIRDYLNRYEERFWLFHPDRPFYQAKSGAKGSAYTSPKLNGVISESESKVRLFSTRSGEEKSKLTYAEAARWLLHLNAYDDAGLKKKIRTGDNLPSFKVGWLGQLGLLVAQGHNLFETLMLNLVLSNCKDDKCWDDAKPIWERDVPDERDRVLRDIPYDQAELLTLQSRRIALQREGDSVTGYALLSGEQFEAENAFPEQMTRWYKTKEGKYRPAKYRRGQAMWREWASFMAAGDKEKVPGICEWHAYLQNVKKVLPRKYVISYQALSVDYAGGSIPSAVDDMYADRLAFNMNLYEELGKEYRQKVRDEVELCEKLSDAVGTLAYRISQAGGGDGSAETEQARERFFYAVDIPFRKWLLTLDAEDEEVQPEDRQWAWRAEVGSIVRRTGRELVEEAGVKALTGRKVSVKVKNKPTDVFYCAPDAYRCFLWNVTKLIGPQPTGKDGTNGKP